MPFVAKGMRNWGTNWISSAVYQLVTVCLDGEALGTV